MQKPAHEQGLNTTAAVTLVTNNAAILILAAGESRRLRQPKQLITFENETLIHRIARRAAASNATETKVVLGYDAGAIERELCGLEEVRTIRNADWREGIGTSIRCGVQALADCDAILIAVCDQPHLKTDLFDQLIAQLERSRSGIVASRYSDTLGVPAIFARQHFSALLALPDHAGARSLLTGDIDSIDFPLGAVDIDTPDDLANL